MHEQISASATIPSPTKIKKIKLTDRQVLRKFNCRSNLEYFEGVAVVNGKRVTIGRRKIITPQKGQPDGSHLLVERKDTGIDFDDPRVFVYQGKLCLSGLKSGKSKDAGYNFLIEVDNDLKLTEFKLVVPEDMSHYAGKSWSPFETPDGRLGFIHSFTPLRILFETRRNKSSIFLEKFEYPGLPFVYGDGRFPAHRGGTAGVCIKNNIFGIGHTTKLRYSKNKLIARVNIFLTLLFGIKRNHKFDHEIENAGNQKDNHRFINWFKYNFLHPLWCLRQAIGSYAISAYGLIHRPFFWKIDMENWSVTEIPIEGEYDPEYNIIDPTSWVDAGNGHFELLTTEAKYHYTSIGSGCIAKYRVVFVQ